MPQTLSSLVWIMAIAAFVPLLLGLLRWRVAAVVMLLAGGALLGPAGLHLINVDESISLLSDLGLGLLFFLAGTEIEKRAVSGRSGRLAAAGWFIALGLAALTAVVLSALHVIADGVGFTLALTSTALGTLLPTLRDNRELTTPFGTLFLGAGAWGEFGPLVGIALLLSAQAMWQASLILVAFLGFAALLSIIIVRFGTPQVRRVLAAGNHTSSQTAVRFTLLAVILLLSVAAHSGLDLVLGAFVSGIIVRRLIGEGGDGPLLERIEAIAFGLLIPIFFVVAGARLDVEAIFHAPLLVIGLVALMAVFRGLPQWFLYRRAIPQWRERARFSLYVATGLPIIIALVTIEVQAGAMKEINGSALICAGAVSVLVFPLVGDLLVRGRSPVDAPAPAPEPKPATEQT